MWIMIREWIVIRDESKSNRINIIFLFLIHFGESKWIDSVRAFKSDLFDGIFETEKIVTSVFDYPKVFSFE